MTLNILTNNNPIAVGRRKLIAKWHEQIQLSSNIKFISTKQKWIAYDDGKQTKVEIPKLVKRWWMGSVDGKANLLCGMETSY